MRTYETREAAIAVRPFAAKAIGCAEHDLVMVRYGDKFRIRTRESLERWISNQRAA